MDSRQPTVNIIVPVYRNLGATQRCLESVLQSTIEAPGELIIIDDASPEAELSTFCAQLAENFDNVQLISNQQNLGFVASVNIGIKASPGRDVVLLNSDTEVANDWLARMRDCAYSQSKIGTVTPLSNNASVCSYPLPLCENTLPTGWTVSSLDRLAAQVNAGGLLELPTAVGFCMYIRRECLDSIGLFDEANFGIGYGEECDFSMRARANGWINALSPNVFVYHQGGQSFSGQTLARIEAAETTLRRIHPDYHLLATGFIDEDPIRPFRDTIDDGRLAQDSAESLPVVTSLRSHRDRLIEGRSNREMALEHARDQLQKLYEDLSAKLEVTQSQLHGIENELDAARIQIQSMHGDLDLSQQNLAQIREQLTLTGEQLQSTLAELTPLQQRDGRWRYLLYVINRLDEIRLRFTDKSTQ